MYQVLISCKMWNHRTLRKDLALWLLFVLFSHPTTTWCRYLSLNWSMSQLFDHRIYGRNSSRLNMIKFGQNCSEWCFCCWQWWYWWLIVIMMTTLEDKNGPKANPDKFKPISVKWTDPWCDQKSTIKNLNIAAIFIVRDSRHERSWI